MIIGFNFDRSQVLGSFIPVDGTLHITRPFHPGTLALPMDAVTFRVVGELDDSSVTVIDFGDVNPNSVPTGAIIGVGHQSQIPHRWR